jgi:hypothetical protein
MIRNNDMIEKSDFTNKSEEKLTTLIQLLQNGNSSLKESVDSKFNTLTQAVNELKGQGAAREKRERLEWAIKNVRLVAAFNYSSTLDGNTVVESTTVLTCILFAFRRGIPCFIQKCFSGSGSGSGSWNEEDHKKFKELLEDRLWDLTGVKPRFGKYDGKECVYYE